MCLDAGVTANVLVSFILSFMISSQIGINACNQVPLF